MKKRNILVAGAAGFLGSHLCQQLVSEGSRVVGIDNLQTGDIAKLFPLKNHDDFSFIEGDVRCDLPDGVYDEIWNLACPASPKWYQADPVDTLLVNVLGMKAVLDLARTCGARVFQASTSEVYGDPQEHPQVESYLGAVNTIGPRAQGNRMNKLAGDK